MSALDLVHLATVAGTRAATYLRSVRPPAGPSGWTLKGSRDFVTDVWIVDPGDRRLTVSAIEAAEFALIGTGFPFSDVSRLEEYQRQFGRVARATSGIRRPGAAALDLADVAAGRFDGFWEQRLSAWDIAAGTLLIREAGGVVTDFAGRDIGIEHTGVVAGNPAIHAWLIETLNADQ